MGLQTIWWHESMPRGTTGAPVPLRREPEISRTTVTSSGTAAASGAAPGYASIAVIKGDTAAYYRVRRAGDTTAASTNDKQTTADTELSISVEPGDTISFIE